MATSSLGAWSMQVAPTTLLITPRYLHLDSDITSEATILCALSYERGGGVPLAGCEFKDYFTNVTWKFNEGSSTAVHATSGKNNCRYHGKGLQRGECGMRLRDIGAWDTFILGCRVRPAKGGQWRYAAMMMDNDPFLHMYLHLSPSDVIVALPGSDVSISGTSEGNFSRCGFSLPHITSWIYFNDGPKSRGTDLAKYHGAGLQHRQCGITLMGVREHMSGFVHSFVEKKDPTTSNENFVELIVATPPDPPQLTLNTESASYVPGDLLIATCTVRNSRPVSNISWYLDREMVRSDSVNEAPVESAWRWDHDLQTIQQRLRHRLDLGDDGKTLTCRAGHLALASGYLDSGSLFIRVRECAGNADCPMDRSCETHACKDPCPGPCAQNALCRVIKHYPTCRCPGQFMGDPYIRCEVRPHCGLTAQTTPLVYKGKPTERGAWPWLVAIYENEDNSFICGGSLVTNKHVVTAAHCVANYTRSLLTIILGKYEQSLNWERETEPRQVANLHVHLSYQKAKPYLFDIAMLVLDDPVHYTPYIQPICLWPADANLDHFINETGTVIGWGRTANETVTNTPRMDRVRMVSQDECRDSYPLLLLFTNNYTLCAGNRDGSGPCTGDSGGPLMVRVKDSGEQPRWYLRGIVSHALYDKDNDTCNLGQYVVYTDVGKFATWINDFIS